MSKDRARILYRIIWVEGKLLNTKTRRRQVKWFKDKFEAQDKILELQERGIKFKLTKHDGKTGEIIQ